MIAGRGYESALGRRTRDGDPSPHRQEAPARWTRNTLPAMTRPVPWPPAPIRTERLVLREPGVRDLAAIIELLSSPEVGTYIGGPDRVRARAVGA